MNVDSSKIRNAVRFALKFLGIEESKFPEIYTSIEFKEIKKTGFKPDEEGSDNGVIEIFVKNNSLEVVKEICHECWHVKQKQINGLHLEYSTEDRMKYSKQNQYMLCKLYNFESEAVGYSYALSYYVYKIATTYFLKDHKKEIKIFSVPDRVSINDVDNAMDVEIINKKLEEQYKKGIDYFKSFLPEKIQNNINLSIKDYPEGCENVFLQFVLNMISILD